MTRLRPWTPGLLYDRRDLQTVVLCALVGSLTGALYARASSASISGELFFCVRQPVLLSALRLSLFPVLMAAALLLQSRALFWLLFFGKGFAVSCLLCIAASFGAGPLSCLLPGLLLETLLPLPAFFLLGAVWYGETGAGRWSLRPILPALLSVLAGLLLERLLFNS